MKHKSLEELLQEYVLAVNESIEDPDNSAKTNRRDLAIQRLREATPVFNQVATSNQQVDIRARGL